MIKLNKKGYIIPLDKLQKQDLDKIKKDLYVIPKDFMDTNEEGYEMYSLTKKNIIVPKYYGLLNFGKPDIVKNLNGKEIDVKFNSKLWENQEKIVNACIEYLQKNEGGILSISCGAGKTVMGIYLISKLKRKALILVQSVFLINQWIRNIEKFTSASFGVLRGKKIDVANKDIVIGTIQSISMIDYDKSIFKKFGTVIVDECFPYNQEIITNKGSLKIGDLYKLFSIVKNIKVMTFNIEERVFEWKNILHVFQNGIPGYLLKLTFITDTGFYDIITTHNHLFLTDNDKYLEAINLNIYDNLKNRNGKMKGCSSVLIHKEIIKSNNDYLYDLETENNHNYVLSINSGIFGPIVHNCHHIGSRVYTHALDKVCSKYTIGLSATPIRKDGLTKVVNWYLGNIMYSEERQGDMVNIYSILYNSKEPKFREFSRYNVKKKEVVPDVVKMTTKLSELENRNNLIVYIINYLRQNPERNTLILGDRLKQLEIIKNKIDTILENEKNNISKTGYYIGGTKEKILDRTANDCNIIFGTYKMAQEGLDIKKLNTIVSLSSHKDIQQAIGRILRPKEITIDLIFVDIIDNISCFPNQYKKRHSYYKKQNYEIKYFYAEEDKIIDNTIEEMFEIEKKTEPYNFIGKFRQQEKLIDISKVNLDDIEN